LPATVRASLEDELVRLREVAPDLAAGTLAAQALVLADQLDDPDTSATAKSMCSRALTDVMDRLRELAPKQEEADQLDHLVSRRAARRPSAAPAARRP
jgi:hypothetical protein